MGQGREGPTDVTPPRSKLKDTTVTYPRDNRGLDQWFLTDKAEMSRKLGAPAVSTTAPGLHLHRRRGALPCFPAAAEQRDVRAPGLPEIDA